jgi:hypothetical protein
VTVNYARLILPPEDGECRRFVFITSEPLSDLNVSDVVGAGRERRAIENRGFNAQKTRMGLEHAYSRSAAGARNICLLMQIGHTVAQLAEFEFSEYAAAESATALCAAMREGFRTAGLSFRSPGPAAAAAAPAGPGTGPPARLTA